MTFPHGLSTGGQENSHFLALAPIINSLACVFLQITWNQNLHTTTQVEGEKQRGISVLISILIFLSHTGKGYQLNFAGK